MKDEFLILMLLLVKGTGFIAGGVAILVHHSRASRTWRKIDGVVDGFTHDRDGNPLVAVRLIVDTAPTRRLVPGDSTSIGLGSEITVLQDPENPGRLAILDPNPVTSGAIAALLIGCTLLALAASLELQS